MILDATPPRQPIGWPLLPLPDAEGQLRYPDLAESIRQNLQVILSTRPGEQLMRPGYGAGLVDFIGEADTITTRRRIHDRISESIGRWEARVDLNRIDVDSQPGRTGQIRVDIAYRIRRTGEARSLGVNLELEG
ncbi:MAG: GPW/gp25 family protein [Chthoniobacteraceae bacterium]